MLLAVRFQRLPQKLAMDSAAYGWLKCGAMRSPISAVSADAGPVGAAAGATSGKELYGGFQKTVGVMLETRPA